MPEIKVLGFDYEKLGDKEVKGKLLNLASRGRSSLKKASKHFEELGEVVADAHELLAEHYKGAYGQWIVCELGVSRQTAENWKNLYEQYGGCQIIGQLDPSALYKLAAPSCPDEARKEVEKLAAKEDKIPTKVVNQIIKKHKPDTENSRSRHTDATESAESERKIVFTLEVEENQWVEAFEAFWERCPRGPKIAISGLVGGSDEEVSIDDALIPSELDSPEFLTAWVDWCKYKGKSYSKRAQRTQINRLAKMGARTAINAIEYSIAQNYKGVFEDKNGSTSSSEVVIYDVE